MDIDGGGISICTDSAAGMCGGSRQISFRSVWRFDAAFGSVKEICFHSGIRNRSRVSQEFLISISLAQVWGLMLLIRRDAAISGRFLPHVSSAERFYSPSRTCTSLQNAAQIPARFAVIHSSLSTEVARTAQRRIMRCLGALLLCGASVVLAQTEDAPQLITPSFVPTFVDLSGNLDPGACRPNLAKVDFAAATVAINNLGGVPGGPAGECFEDGVRVACPPGFGPCTEYTSGGEQTRIDCLPDADTPEVYKLEGVSFIGGQRVDLTVSVLNDEYTTVPGNTGRQSGPSGQEVFEFDSIGVISKDDFGEFLFEFTFEDGSKAELDELIFSIYDVDQDGPDGEAGSGDNFVPGVSVRERVVVTPVEATLLAYYLTDTTQVATSESGGAVTANSLVTGLGAPLNWPPSAQL
eukprot:6178589-Pleurochrysis_carterae.AAC.2